jgi:small subunit ribosomal protein S16
MLRIRLSRNGSKSNTFYKIVVIEKGNKMTGAYLDLVGYWHPSKAVVEIDKKKLAEWVEKGALVSDAVKNLMK